MAAKKSTRKAAKKSARKSSAGKKKLRTYDGPAEWIMPMMEEVYSQLKPKERDDTPAIGRSKTTRKKAKTAKGKARKEFISAYQEGQGESVLADLPRDYWAHNLKEYHKRRSESPGRLRGLVSRLTSPVRGAEVSAIVDSLSRVAMAHPATSRSPRRRGDCGTGRDRPRYPTLAPGRRRCRDRPTAV